MLVLASSPAVPASPGNSPNLSDPAVRQQLSPSAVEGVLRLAAIWRLSSDESCGLLGDMSERTWFRMKKGERLPGLSQDILTRISVLVGIFKGLRLLFSEDLADEWMRLPNEGPLFRGETPLAYAIGRGIPGLLEIRAHVDALRGGL